MRRQSPDRKRDDAQAPSSSVKFSLHAEFEPVSSAKHRPVRRVFKDAVVEESSPLVRQWTILRSLSVRRYGVAVKELAAEAGVSVKTLRRDLETFQSVGFPIEASTGAKGVLFPATFAGDGASGSGGVSIDWGIAGGIVSK
jgi:hypothetical protein